MNILLTNDDGVHSEGINALYETFSEHYNVYIIAPDEEKSGCSTAVSFKKHLKIINIAEKTYSVQGFTADCVNIGIKSGIIPDIDLVISGINHGPNLGDDIYFSGTVGGARVAYIYGISGIAISLNCRQKSPYFKDASDFLLNYIEDSGLFSGDSCKLLNINYPDIPKNKVNGIKYSNLGRRKYNDSYNIKSKKDGEFILEFMPQIGSGFDELSDITELENGYITITPLTLDCTDYEQLEKEIAK